MNSTFRHHDKITSPDEIIDTNAPTCEPCGQRMWLTRVETTKVGARNESRKGNRVQGVRRPTMDLVTAVGGVAAVCTTVSYFPQLKKCWQTGHTGDLSLRMLSILAAGIAMWSSTES